MTAITAKKSYKDGHVSVHVTLKGRGFQADSVRIDGSTDLSSAEARKLAADLIEQANRADARAAAKAQADTRRAKWREREIAAGRMKVMSLRDVLAR